PDQGRGPTRQVLLRSASEQRVSATVVWLKDMRWRSAALAECSWMLAKSDSASYVPAAAHGQRSRRADDFHPQRLSRVTTVGDIILLFAFFLLTFSSFRARI